MGYSPWSHKESDTTEWLSTHTHTHCEMRFHNQHQWVSTSYQAILGSVLSEIQGYRYFNDDFKGLLLVWPCCYSIHDITLALIFFFSSYGFSSSNATTHLYIALSFWIAWAFFLCSLLLSLHMFSSEVSFTLMCMAPETSTLVLTTLWSPNLYKQLS